MQELKALSAAVLLAASLVPGNARASAPAGVWVKVQEVVYVPDATSPTHVRIHGALMLYDGDIQTPRPYLGYTSPALGYMYYRCPDGQAEICRQEWSDLAANIAKPDSECLGFGDTSLPTGTLRQPGDAPQNPDTYPIQSGVSPGFSPCQAIANYLLDDPGAGGVGGVGGAGAAGGVASSGGAGTTSGGMPASRGGASAVPASGSSGAPSGGSGSSETTAGRPASGAPRVAPEEPPKTATAESRAAGCSITNASGAASLLGLAAAAGAFALALARRNRSRKRP
jgi:hypothetical protein